MQWILIILALIFAIPTYGISIIVLIVLLPMFGAKSRREMFPPLIRKALIADDWITTEDIYFEAAARYAKENNGQMMGSNSYLFYTLIDNEKVQVVFARTLDGGVEIRAEREEDMLTNLMSNFDEAKER
jgi:hypothetical protein